MGIILTHFHADHAYGTAGILVFGYLCIDYNEDLLMIIPSEFLRGREEGEVEIFAHDSFPTYFRQVKKLSTGKKLSASKKTFDLWYQPLACDIQHGSFYDRTFSLFR